MPRTLVSEVERPLWAFCHNANCNGYEMEEVPGVVQEVGDTFLELGGKGTIVQGIERSNVTYSFKDPEADAACRSCGKPRELSAEPRPEYDPLAASLPGADAPFIEPDAEVVALRRQVAELAELVKDRAA